MLWGSSLTHIIMHRSCQLSNAYGDRHKIFDIIHNATLSFPPFQNIFWWIFFGFNDGNHSMKMSKTSCKINTT